MNSGRWNTLLLTGQVESNETDMSYFADTHGVTPHVIPDMGRSLSPRDIIHILRVWRIMLRIYSKMQVSDLKPFQCVPSGK